MVSRYLNFRNNIFKGIINKKETYSKSMTKFKSKNIKNLLLNSWAENDVKIDSNNKFGT